MGKRTKYQINADRALISDLYIKGYTQAHIAAAISELRDYELTQQTISNDLKRVQEMWIENTTVDLDTHKGMELERINRLEREYWTQYESSQEDATIKKAVSDGSSSDKKRYEATTKSRDGDPRFLQGIERCIQLRMKLLGLEAALKHEHTGAGGGAMQVSFSWEDMIKRDDDTSSA